MNFLKCRGIYNLQNPQPMAKFQINLLKKQPSMYFSENNNLLMLYKKSRLSGFVG
jgi:hypothetical protein